MKKMMFINKAISKPSCVTVIAMVGLLVTGAFATEANAQTNLKKLLAGTSSKTWQLSEVKASGKVIKNIDFDESDAFALKSDLAQLIPYEIEFNADGTCENTYVSQYDNGTISDDDYTAPCEWSVEGNNIEIIENVDEDAEIEGSEDEVITLIGVSIKSDELRSKFSIGGGYTGGVESLVFKNN